MGHDPCQATPLYVAREVPILRWLRQALRQKVSRMPWPLRGLYYHREALAMWHWYFSQDNELFCDIDDRPETDRRIQVARGRLRGAMAARRLEVADYWIYHSQNAHHHHLMIRLCSPMPALQRLMWERRLVDDNNRGDFNLARLASFGESLSLLISREYRRDYWRGPDYVCKCSGKHTQEAMALCPIAIQHNRPLTADFFGGAIYLNDPIRTGKQ